MDASASAPGGEKPHGERTVSGLKQRLDDVVAAAEAATAELETAKRAREVAVTELRGTQVQASIAATTIQATISHVQEETVKVDSELKELKSKENCQRQFEQMASIELAGKCSELSADGKQENSTDNYQGKATDGHNGSDKNETFDSEAMLTDLADKVNNIEAEMHVLEEYQKDLLHVITLNSKEYCERQLQQMAYVELAGKCSELSADGNQENSTDNYQGKATDDRNVSDKNETIDSNGMLTDLADKVDNIEGDVQECRLNNSNKEGTSQGDADEGMQASTTSDSSPWALLDRDLIITAVSSVFCPAERAQAGCVNKWWKEAMKQVPQIPMRLLPWAIFPSTQSPRYHSTIGKTTYKLNIPEDVKKARFCGSFEGWWFALAWDQPRHHGDLPRHPELYNLKSEERIELPINARIGDSIHIVKMKAAVLSAPPRPLGAKYVVAAILHIENIEKPRVAFWQENMKEWIVEQTFDLRVEDLIWYLGNLHVLTAYEGVHVLVPEFDEMSAWRINYRVQQRPTYAGDVHFATADGRRGSLRRYLVESAGDLMMVVKLQYANQHAEFLRVVSLNVEIEEGADVFGEDDFFRTHNGDMEDEIAGRASWDEVEDHFGRLLFVGRACSRIFRERCEEPAIYYLDDREIGDPNTGLFLMDDTGRFSLIHRRVDAWPPTAGEALLRASDRLPVWCIH